MLESMLCLFRSTNLKNKSFSQINYIKNTFLSTGLSVLIPLRTSIIVKRPFPPTLYKDGNKPRLRKRTFYFDFAEDTNNRPDPLIDVILSSYVQGVGNVGDLISMKRSTAYNKLLMPGLAEYATTEMIDFSKNLKADAQLQEKLVPVSIERCMKYLEKSRISIVMNQHKEWTIERWHVRTSARKAGIHILSDDCIRLPEIPIRGPDMALEGKEFFITVTINKKYNVKVRCIIHHWTADPLERLPFKSEWWLAPAEMLFPDDEDNSNPT